MEYIDKEKYREDFNVYSRDYLKDRKNSRTGLFNPRLADDRTYDKFSAKKYKKTAHPQGSGTEGWLKILLNETKGRCCYCMRRLPVDKISIEHLVPENFGDLIEIDEFNYYANKSQDIKENVVLGSVFDNNAHMQRIDVDKIKQFPHLIAHSNLFPACQNDTSGCSCNNHRGNKRIIPLMLMNDIKANIVYTEEGEMELLYPNEDGMVEETKKHLDLNTDRLKTIRELWYKFSRKGITSKNCRKLNFVEIDGRIRKALDLKEDDIIPDRFQDYVREENGLCRYFELFLRYDWFYHYYSTNYPIK